MYVDAEDGGPKLSHEEDSRITPFGAIMRKYRLDELPVLECIERICRWLVLDRNGNTLLIRLSSGPVLLFIT